MAMKYDPEFARLAGPFLSSQDEDFAPHDVSSRRIRIADFMKNVKPQLSDDIDHTIHYAQASDGHQVAIYHVQKKGLKLSTPGPAVLHIHGGGYISVSVEDTLPSIAAYVSASAVPMFSVEYRLAPENRFPVPLEDCWSALQWLQHHAATLNIDPARLAIFGESAGGGLAAALALLARDRNFSPPLAKQILVYPMLDDRTTKDHTNGMAVFHASDVVTGWGAYLGKDYETDSVSPYAAPARVTDVKGLPRLYMDVGQLDMFVFENVAYLQKFMAENSPAEFHLYEGVPHAFQRFAPSSKVAQQAFANRLGAILTV